MAFAPLEPLELAFDASLMPGITRDFGFETPSMGRKAPVERPGLVVDVANLREQIAIVRGWMEDAIGAEQIVQRVATIALHRDPQQIGEQSGRRRGRERPAVMESARNPIAAKDAIDQVGVRHEITSDHRDARRTDWLV